MRPFRSTPALLAAFCAAALVSGAALAPAAGSGQQEQQKKMMTVSGIAIQPDGSPAVGLPVEVKAPNKKLVDAGGPGGQAPPPELLLQQSSQGAQQPMISLGKSVTDEQGKFAVKFEVAQDKPSIQLEIGDKRTTAWLVKPLENKHKDMDLGRLELRSKV